MRKRAHHRRHHARRTTGHTYHSKSGRTYKLVEVGGSHRHHKSKRHHSLF